MSEAGVDATISPPSATDQPSAATDQPSAATDQPSAATDQPSADTDQPSADAAPANKPDKTNKSPRRTTAKSPRGPPPPTAEQLAEREKSFVLDCIAVDCIAKDFANCQPKLGPAIPSYNSQKDRHVRVYFTREQVDQTLRKTQQDKGGCSIDGPVIDRFLESGAGYRYLHARNAAPSSARAGHSKDQISGHGQFLSNPKPIFGFNGEYGYRRNTPWLRTVPSPFGTDPRSPTH